MLWAWLRLQDPGRAAAPPPPPPPLASSSSSSSGGSEAPASRCQDSSGHGRGAAGRAEVLCQRAGQRPEGAAGQAGGWAGQGCLALHATSGSWHGALPCHCCPALNHASRSAVHSAWEVAAAGGRLQRLRRHNLCQDKIWMVSHIPPLSRAHRPSLTAVEQANMAQETQ